MKQPIRIPPFDQTENVKALILNMRLIIRGLIAIGSPPTEEEEWGIYLILDNIEERLTSISDQLFEAKQINQAVTIEQPDFQ